jgi:DNA polymerase-3 subunit delta
MIITLAGANSFLMSRRLKELIQEFEAEHGDLAIERIDGAEVEIGTLVAAVSSQPFLSSRKFVVVRDLAANKTAAEAIEQIISSVSEDTDLILYETVTDKRSSFYKTLKSKTQFEEHADLDSNSLAKWLTGEAARQNIGLSQSDAVYLIDRVGTNQAMLASELEKLALYDSQISRQSIDLLTERNPQSRVFDLLDAAFTGQVKKALTLYEEQRAQKVEPQAILALLIWQIHLIAIAKAAGNRSSDEVASEAKISPYPLGKALALAKKIKADKLRQMIADLAEIDYKNRTVYLDIDEALKSYISTL